MSKKFRIFLLRVLIGWWMIILFSPFLWMLAYLLGGRFEANDCVAYLARLMWYGEED